MELGRCYLTNLAMVTGPGCDIRTAERVGLFTTDLASPAVVAEALLDRRIDYFTVYVWRILVRRTKW